MMGSGMALYGTQDLSQLGGAEFAGSARAVAVASESDVGHGLRLSPTTQLASPVQCPTKPRF